jgi:capsular polysaccharide export protein
MVRIIYAFNVAKWKRPLLKKYFKKDIIKYISLAEELRTSNKVRMNGLLIKRTVFLVWGMKEPYDLVPFAKQHDIPIWRIEDGFVRSIGLGSEKQPPYSLCIDKSGIYFNSKVPSDLESLILNHASTVSKKNIIEADVLINKIKEFRISKYNDLKVSNYKLTSYGDRKKILVIGQVEDDQSIIFGTKTPLTNLDILKVAVKENPECDIYFKSHPDYTKSKRNNISDSTDFDEIYLIPDSVPLNSLFEQVDHVYTISSLGGFEALLYEKKVTVLGCPFYSGWGLTDDRYSLERRNVEVSLQVLFAAAYMIYPKYLNPNTGKRMQLDEVIHEFQAQIEIEESYSNYRKEHLYNAKTKADMNVGYLEKYEELLIISDNVEVLSSSIIRGKDVTIAFVSEALIRECGGVIPDNVRVVSLPRYLNIGLSDFEREACVFNSVLNNKYIDLLKSLNLPCSEKMLEAFAFDFEQIMYQENSKYLTVQKCGLNSQALVMSFNNPIIADQYHKMVIGQYARCDALADLYILAEERNGELFSTGNNVIKRESFSTLKTNVNSLYHSLSREVEKEQVYNEQKKFVTVVGNINNRNYTYSKIALGALKQLSNKYNVYYVPVIDSDNDVEDNKFILNTDGMYGITVVNSKLNTDFEFDSLPLASTIINSLIETLPKDYVDFISSRVIRYFTQFSSKIHKYIYFSHKLSGSKGMLTCLENSFISRCITDIHNENNRDTIALQSWRISRSPRNSLPIVKYMGAIDTYQKKLFETLGFPSSNIKLVGSVNLFDKIDLISDSTNTQNDYLFILQHSIYKDTASALNIIKHYFSENSNVKIYIKPHPHQDFAVLELLNSMKSNNVVILNKSSDTYEYVSKCNYVISIFSSVLFEAALARKKTIVMNLNSLDESINYAKMGLALEVTDSESFKSVLDALQTPNNSAFNDIENNVNDFLSSNPQFFNRKILSSFIDSIGS